MLATLTRWLLLAALALGAGWLRVADLGRRPMHADEANQAVKTGELLETGRYAFDPHDHHGPTLYYAALPVAWLRGQQTLAELTETTVRLVPAFFGVGTVLLITALATPLGRWPTFVAGAFAALSPTLVYFSRDFIQETLLLAFTLTTLGSAWHWWITGRTRWAFVAGIGLGLMFATKASAPIFIFAAAIAAAAIRPTRPVTTRIGRDALVAALAALVCASAFYTSFGANLDGLRDAVIAPFAALGRVSGASGHEKPFSYYAQLFLWQRGAGVVWQQLTFCALALTGTGVAFARRDPLLRAAAIYTLVVGLVLSLTPYKTPWHAIHLVPGLCVLAAGALGAVATLPTGRWVAALFAVFTGVMLGTQTRLAAFTYAADARNPLAYVHSTPDVQKARAMALDALATAPGLPVRVIGDEYWPLPWYLRGVANVGYWTTAPADCDGAIVFVSPAARADVSARLRGRYRETFLGLRPGVICHVFIRQP